MCRRRAAAARLAAFFAGIGCNALGVVLVIKAGMGSSPIVAIPYSLSLVFPALSVGTWVMAFHFFLILLQVLLLRLRIRERVRAGNILLQIVLAVVFGTLTDLADWCLAWLRPESYLLRLVVLVAGCAALAFGSYLELLGGIGMLPPESYIGVLARALSVPYGNARVISDLSMTAVAVVICLLCLHALQGVREGTLVAALITGNFVKLYQRSFPALSRYFDACRQMRAPAEQTAAADPDKN